VRITTSWRSKPISEFERKKLIADLRGSFIVMVQPMRREAMIAVLPSLRPQQASLASVGAAARLLGHEIVYLLIRLCDEVAQWHARVRDRDTLGTLDERGLRDIGLSRADIADEIQKPFWRS
jgi:uncharacterized protein YjiS (DUF1127 family)